MENEIDNVEYSNLVSQISTALTEGRNKAFSAVNTILVETYWNIGKYIVEFEQNGKVHAQYGDALLANLSKDLTVLFGKGFSRSNLTYMRKLYVSFPKCETLSHNLSWSHYFEILKADSDLEISFYTKECEKESWSVRELKRQMKSMLFHRIALSKDKNQVLELGRGFAFIGRQYKMQIGAKQFKVDLVFYNYILKCFVLIDLKRGEIEHYDVGQMNMYLNYFKSEKMADGDNLPIGIVLGAYKDKLLMEYATQGIENNLFVSKYQLYLPNKTELQSELEKFLENNSPQEPAPKQVEA